jgi:hypothetical protein
MEDSSLTLFPSQIQHMAAVVAGSGVKGSGGVWIQRRSSPSFLCSLGVAKNRISTAGGELLRRDGA